MKKRIVSLLCVAALAVSTVLVGCGSNTASSDSEEKKESEVKEEEAKATSINVAALKGPTAMGMVKLMDQAENKETETNEYNFTIASAPDEITPSIVQGKVDIAAVPANLAAVLSKKTEGKVQVLAINTLGVLYIVENGDSVQSVEDLKGKTIYASGKGSTPEYALNYMLEA
ncbi:MAG: ABC transporter substrate-binding protein, partial [Lachnospiraceae bacterium]|nr:ABC transporter substrate-binding protein [Lachnospiraceae bacterium]